MLFVFVSKFNLDVSFRCDRRRFFGEMLEKAKIFVFQIFFTLFFDSWDLFFRLAISTELLYKLFFTHSARSFLEKLYLDLDRRRKACKNQFFFYDAWAVETSQVTLKAIANPYRMRLIHVYPLL